MSRLLDVEDLQIELITARGVVRAVDGISLHVDPGEAVALIGESGSGKSTTAMGLLRLLPPDLAVLSGRAVLAGHDVIADPAAIQDLRGRVVGLVPQDPMTALSPVHTVGSRLVELVRLRHRGTTRRQARVRAAELLERVRVPDPERVLERYPHQLSGGLQQRVLIACALVGEPELLVADEPTSALDVTVQAGVLDLLMELQERTGVAILMITHDLGVARMVSDRVHVMRAGRFVESGEVEQVIGAPQHPYPKELLAAVPRLSGEGATA
ncbi:ABC transporter ATP-binding protein [Saccharopolyspora sp. NPDC000359]|uniref:ABC transporter ATP-binding protein n=1 Tax=Saccharopolyspora sp. NPDC000359 TaxID=3154251 RepID=UPI00331BA142